MDLVQAAIDGDRLALARLLTQAENDTAQGREYLNRLFAYSGKAHLIGVTGSPGTGKSSLVNQIALHYRKGQRGGEPGGKTAPRVAIIAVDPTSPFTGGAILGDRVRMRDLAGDPGVFIRSMATRGSLGGLAKTTAALVQVFDAVGYDIILIETVGAGQAEVDIARLAHTTLVVEAPGLGDDIQAIKAGILETADILVINKADRPGIEAAERALRSMVQLAHPVMHVFQTHSQYAAHEAGKTSALEFTGWLPPIQKTIATEGKGVKELLELIDQHAHHLKESGEWQKRETAHLQSVMDELIRETLVEKWRTGVSDDQYFQVLHNLVDRNLSPWQAVDKLINGGKK